LEVAFTGKKFTKPPGGTENSSRGLGINFNREKRVRRGNTLTKSDGLEKLNPLPEAKDGTNIPAGREALIPRSHSKAILKKP